MTLAELGALGEFIGSLLVLITLVILIIQVREAHKAILANSYSESARMVYEGFGHSFSSQYLMSALVKDKDGSSLTTDEELALTNYWHALIRRAEAIHYQRAQGLISKQRLDQFGNRMAVAYSIYPMFKVAWNLDRKTMLTEFRDWAEAFLAD
ncbi:MAG: hypothetical protein ACR2QV_00725 [Gammaproteobacteria bacterium]